jgi:hypothetical protein
VEFELKELWIISGENFGGLNIFGSRRIMTRI